MIFAFLHQYPEIKAKTNLEMKKENQVLKNLAASYGECARFFGSPVLLSVDRLLTKTQG